MYLRRTCQIATGRGHRRERRGRLEARKMGSRFKTRMSDWYLCWIGASDGAAVDSNSRSSLGLRQCPQVPLQVADRVDGQTQPHRHRVPSPIARRAQNAWLRRFMYPRARLCRAGSLTQPVSTAGRSRRGPHAHHNREVRTLVDSPCIERPTAAP